MERVDKEEQTVIDLFEKQVLLLNYFYVEDKEIYGKYSNRWSSLLWNCCVMTLNAKPQKVHMTVKAASYSFRLVITSSSVQTEETMELLFSRLLSMSQNTQYSSLLSPLFDVLYSTYPTSVTLESCLDNTAKLARTFRFLLAWNRVNPSISHFKSFMNAVTRSRH